MMIVDKGMLDELDKLNRLNEVVGEGEAVDELKLVEDAPMEVGDSVERVDRVEVLVGTKVMVLVSCEIYDDT